MPGHSRFCTHGTVGWHSGVFVGRICRSVNHALHASGRPHRFSLDSVFAIRPGIRRALEGTVKAS